MLSAPFLREEARVARGPKAAIADAINRHAASIAAAVVRLRGVGDEGGAEAHWGVLRLMPLAPMAPRGTPGMPAATAGGGAIMGVPKNSVLPLSHWSSQMRLKRRAKR